MVPVAGGGDGSSAAAGSADPRKDETAKDAVTRNEVAIMRNEPLRCGKCALRKKR
jgi:hypothetical protein